MTEWVVVLCTRAHIESGPALDVRMRPVGHGMVECPSCANKVQVLAAAADTHRALVPERDPLGLSQTRP